MNFKHHKRNNWQPATTASQNPVEEGLVFRAEDYIYSSAADYAGEKGLPDVIIIK